MYKYRNFDKLCFEVKKNLDHLSVTVSCSVVERSVVLKGKNSLQEFKIDKYEKWPWSQGIEMALPTPGSDRGGGGGGEGVLECQ